MKVLIALFGFALTTIQASAQNTHHSEIESPQEACKDSMFKRECEQIQTQLADVLRKEKTVDAMKPDADALKKTLDEGTWNRSRDAKGPSDDENFKSELEAEVKDILNHAKKKEPFTTVDASKAFGRASTPSTAEAPGVGPQILTFAQRNQIIDTLNQYTLAIVQRDRAKKALAKAIDRGAPAKMTPEIPPEPERSAPTISPTEHNYISSDDPELPTTHSYWHCPYTACSHR